MSTPATVPVFSPDGSLGDIPADQLPAAVKAGAKPGVHIVAPDGSKGVIPADRTSDAVKGGAKLEPIQDQPIQHPGFWVTLGSDLGGMVKGAWHGAVDPLTDTHEDLVRKLHAEQASDQALENSPEHQAHGAIYRNVTTPAAQLVGINVPGMEQSAAEGDIGGVAGHAAAPVAAAALTEGVSRGAGALGEAADSATGLGVKAGAKAALKTLPAAAVRRIPYVGSVAEDMYHAGADAYAKAQPAADAGAPYPAQPPIELVQANALTNGGKPAVSPSDALGAIPLAKLPPQAVQQAVGELGRNATIPSITARANEISLQLQKALGTEPVQIKPGVTMRNQFKSAPAEAAKLPEGFTPVESTALKGYKYDPDAREFEYVTKDGTHYVRGDVDPSAASKFEATAEKTGSFGKAWHELRNNPQGGVGQFKVINGKRVPVKPVVSEMDQIPEDEWRAGQELQSAGVENTPVH